MAKIYNTDLTKGIAKNAAIQQNFDKVPNELAEKVVPTMETNPQLLRYTNYLIYNSKTSTGDLAIGTTPKDKDLYITAYNVSFIKDAACDSSAHSLSLVVIPDETQASTRIFTSQTLPLTAQTETHFCQLAHPLKLKRNSALSLTSNAYAAGIYNRSVVIYGYTIDNPNA